MVGKLKHINLFFIVVFAITWLPFNVLHLHEEDLHDIALAQENSQNHHCQLDDNFCNTANTEACNHTQHLSKPIEKCFVCKFNFTKNYYTTTNKYLQPKQHVYVLFTEIKQDISIVFQSLKKNKSPPFLVS